ncbi:MAG TPA: hypothetical protein VGC26_06890 [Afipia sp.]
MTKHILTKDERGLISALMIDAVTIINPRRRRIVTAWAADRI